MSAFWVIWAALVLVAVCAIVLVAVSVQRTIVAAGWGRGKLYRGPGAIWFWSGIAIALLDGAALATIALTL